MLHAVITGDIVNSTLLEPAAETKLRHHLGDILSPHQHEFFRGDSFQVYLTEPKVALKISLLCRTAAIGLTPEQSQPVSDVRVSIGLGPVQAPIETLATAKGEAFLLSGRALDELGKAEGRLIIVTQNKLANLGLTVMSDYINSIYRHMTPKQAEVIFELLKGHSQQQVAEKLNRSKSTINQHVTAGRWDELENILTKFHEIVQLISYDN